MHFQSYCVVGHGLSLIVHEGECVGAKYGNKHSGLSVTIVVSDPCMSLNKNLVRRIFLE